MVREEFIRHADRHMQDRPAVSFDFRAELSPSQPPTPRHPRETPRALSSGRMGRMRDSISRRGEGMRSLEYRRAAPQWRRFRQGSVPGDASGPSAFDFNEQVNRYID